MSGRHYAQPVTVRERIYVFCGDIPQITIVFCIRYSKHILGGAFLHVFATIVALWILGVIGGGEH